MAEFKKWISYLYAYSGEIKGKNVGFVRVEVREGCCRLSIGVKGAYGCDAKGLQVGLYLRRDGGLKRIVVGHMRIREGVGEFEQVTQEDNLFDTGIELKDSGGLWLTCEGRETIYLASWEKNCLDVREFLSDSQEGPSAERNQSHQEESNQEESPQKAQEQTMARERIQAAAASVRAHPSPRRHLVRVCPIKQRSLEELPQPSLWESLCRYYPKIAPELRQQGIELIKIRPADIRYLPQGLWYYGSNSFLLHGYYHYKYLVLGRISSEEGQSYLLGVPGVKEEREQFSAQMFGFQQFLPQQGQLGYWYTQIHL